MAKNIHGGGANTNVSGLAFESQESVLDYIGKAKGFTKRSESKCKNKGKYFSYESSNGLELKVYNQVAFNHCFIKEELKIKYKDKISKELRPDEFVICGDKFFVMEKKYQKDNGSVDEKLQSFPFKIRQYSRLLEVPETDIFYIYILSNYFYQDKYKDVRDYICLFPNSRHCPNVSCAVDFILLTCSSPT